MGANRWGFADERLAVGDLGGAAKATPRSRPCSQGDARFPPIGASGIFAQWDWAATVTTEWSEAPEALAKPGFAMRSASRAAKSESHDFIARIGPIRRDLGVQSPER